VQPGVQGPNARCWLKNSVPPPVASNCCVSGVTTIVVTGADVGVGAEQRIPPAVSGDLPTQGTPVPIQHLDARCEMYARSANGHFTTMQSRAQCHVPTGGRWQNNFYAHYNWCVAAPREEAQAEYRARDQHLRDCGALHGL
jgi:hypothetical protein